MLQVIRKHLTPSAGIALLALIFALTGGAFAASGHDRGPASRATTSTAHAAVAKGKAKPGPRGPRGPVGPKGATGATGSNGPTGAAGAKGETGAAGATGAQGLQGETGKEGKAGAEGEEGTPGAAGKEGSPWTAGGTLPSGSTETGAWSSARFENVTEGYSATPISFMIPLAAALTHEHVHYVSLEEQEAKTVPAACKGKAGGVEVEGSVAQPLAAPGELCVYQGVTYAPETAETFAVNLIEAPAGPESTAGAGTSGAIVHVVYEGPAEEHAAMQGSWAVTGAS